MRDFSPLARIILRYVAGAGLLGSVALGERFASDPDVIFVTSASIGAAVEAWYAWAKRKGGQT